MGVQGTTSSTSQLPLRKPSSIRRGVGKVGAMKQTLLILMAVALAGCGTAQLQKTWNSRLGWYTFENAVLEYGPPTRKEVLPSGVISAVWAKTAPTNTRPVRNLATGEVMYYNTTGGSTTLTCAFAANEGGLISWRIE